MHLFVERLGEGQPVLLLLHGLGAHGAVFRTLAERLRARFRGRILMPDLRGHGRSPHAVHYGYGHHAADLAELLAPGDRVFAVGHSMGGMVALALASGLYGVGVASVFAFNVKASFSEAELAKLAAFARSPLKWFESREEAAARFLRVAGLEGIVRSDDPIAQIGIREENGRWRLAADPRTVLAAGPELSRLLAFSEAPVTLARAANDAVVSLDELRALGREILDIPGLGHNAHVEDPGRCAAMVLDWLEASGGR